MKMVTTLVLLSSLAMAQPRAVRDAQKHLAVGRFEAAIASLEKLRGKQRDEATVVRMKLVAWRGLGASDKIVDLGPKWLASNSKDAEMQVWVGEAMIDLAASEGRLNLRALGLCEEAMNCADAALAVEPMHAGAVELKAASLVNIGRGDDAIKLVDRMVKKRPGNVGFRVVQARTFSWVGKTGLAIGELNKSATRFKDAAALPLERSAIHMSVNQRDEAVRALAEAVQCRVMNKEHHKVAGELLWRSSGAFGQWDEGLKTAIMWSRAHKDSGVAYWWAGYFLERKGMIDDASKAYRASWEASALPEAAYHLGLLLGRAGQEKRALELVKTAIERNVIVREGTVTPGDALIQLGGLHAGAGNFARAVEVLSVGGDLLADDYRLQQNLGFCYRELGTQQNGRRKKSLARRSWRKSAMHYERASAAVRVADVEASVKAQVLNDTGLMFHYHLNQLSKGIKYYTEALEYDDRYIDAIENMGVVMLKKKRWKQAISWFDKVLARQPARGTSLKGKKAAEEMMSGRK